MTWHCKVIFVAIATDNLQTLVAFYRALFGIDPQVEIPQVYAEFHLPGLQLGLFHPQETHRKEFVNTEKSTVSLCVEVDDLEAAIAHLSPLGCPYSQSITIASHGREIYAYDPDGNRLILHESS